MQRDLPLLRGGEGLVGHQGEDEFGEGWHAAMIVAGVSPPSPCGFRSRDQRIRGASTSGGIESHRNIAITGS